MDRIRAYIRVSYCSYKIKILNFFALFQLAMSFFINFNQLAKKEKVIVSHHNGDISNPFKSPPLQMQFTTFLKVFIELKNISYFKVQAYISIDN